MAQWSASGVAHGTKAAHRVHDAACACRVQVPPLAAGACRTLHMERIEAQGCQWLIAGLAVATAMRRQARQSSNRRGPQLRTALQATGSASGTQADSTSGTAQGSDELSPARAAIGKRLRDRLADGISAQESEVDAVPTDSQRWIQREEVDLNGIDPLNCIIGSFPVAAVSYGFWVLTGTFAQYFVENPVQTEFYPVERLSIALQTIAVGLSSLAAGIFGVTALGLFLLGCRILFGVATGELDPSKESATQFRRSTAERVADVLTKDPIDVAKEMRKRS
mmetsp:Transcript_60145/g.135343  ORF Transcript_60145/g.135343 Transcript_60145/m.135343 type:complete len:279 (-) Transcript_60145:36-872(-)